MVDFFLFVDHFRVERVDTSFFIYRPLAYKVVLFDEFLFGWGRTWIDQSLLFEIFVLVEHHGLDGM